MSADEPPGERPIIRIGLITDPDLPQQVAEHLARRLPEQLSDEHGSTVEIDVSVDPVTAGRHGTDEILQAARERREQQGWKYAICLTDLPLRVDNRPVLANLDVRERVALVCLPALGGFQPYRRAQQLVLQVWDEFTKQADQSADNEGDQRGLASALTALLAPIHRDVVTGDDDRVDIRYSATRTRGRLRLLTGMVRTNRPWRLVFGMSRALAAAVATSAFGLSSSTIWLIGDQLGVPSRIAAVVAVVMALAVWLIAAHHLWETRNRSDAYDREQIVLYNVSTVVTLTVGVACFYLTLFVINLGIAAFLVPSTLLTSTLGHPATPITYVTLAWAFTTMGTLAGALGSSLETDEAVRQAAYGYRENQRRAEHEQGQSDQTDAANTGTTEVDDVEPRRTSRQM